MFHCSSKQELLHASVQSLANATPGGVASYPPVTIHVYPLTSVSPPFPYLAGAPIDHASGKVPNVDLYLRSAGSLSYTRTLELLRRQLGPHFPLEELWEKHTYYVSGFECEVLHPFTNSHDYP